MNRMSLLASAVTAALALSSASATAATVYDHDGTTLDIFGRVQAVGYSRHHGYVEHKNTLVSSGRLGISARSKVNDSVSVLAFQRWDMADGDPGNYGNGIHSREMYVGADFGDYGLLRFGRFESAFYSGFSYFTDLFEDAHDYVGNADKRAGQIDYSWSNYGLTVGVSVQTAKNEVDQEILSFAGYEDAVIDVDKGAALGIEYMSPDVVFGPIGVRAGYEILKANDNGSTTGGLNFDRTTIWGVGLSWGHPDSGLLLAAQYAGGEVKYKNASRAKDVETKQFASVIGYNFDCGLTVLTGYEWIKGSAKHDGEAFMAAMGEDFKKDKYKKQQIPLYIGYAFNDQLSAWIECDFETKSQKYDGSTRKNNYYQAGIRYTF